MMTDRLIDCIHIRRGGSGCCAPLRPVWIGLIPGLVATPIFHCSNNSGHACDTRPIQCLVQLLCLCLWSLLCLWLCLCRCLCPRLCLCRLVRLSGFLAVWLCSVWISVCLVVCVSDCVSVRLSLFLSLPLPPFPFGSPLFLSVSSVSSVCLPVRALDGLSVLVCLSACLCHSLCLLVCLFVCPLVCLFVRLSVCRSVRLFACWLACCPHLCLSVCLSVCLVCLPLSVCPSVRLLACFCVLCLSLSVCLLACVYLYLSLSLSLWSFCAFGGVKRLWKPIGASVKACEAFVKPVKRL